MAQSPLSSSTSQYKIRNSNHKTNHNRSSIPYYHKTQILKLNDLKQKSGIKRLLPSASKFEEKCQKKRRVDIAKQKDRKKQTPMQVTATEEDLQRSFYMNYKEGITSFSASYRAVREEVRDKVTNQPNLSILCMVFVLILITTILISQPRSFSDLFVIKHDPRTVAELPFTAQFTFYFLSPQWLITFAIVGIFNVAMFI